MAFGCSLCQESTVRLFTHAKFTHCSGIALFISNAGQQGSRSSSEPMQLLHICGTCLPFMTDKSDTLKHDHLHMYAHACVLSHAHTHTEKKKRSMTMKCTFSHQQSFTRLHFYVQWDTAKMKNSSASVSKVYATFFVVIITHMHKKNTFFNDKSHNKIQGISTKTTPRQ